MQPSPAIRIAAVAVIALITPGQAQERFEAVLGEGGEIKIVPAPAAPGPSTGVQVSPTPAPSTGVQVSPTPAPSSGIQVSPTPAPSSGIQVSPTPSNTEYFDWFKDLNKEGTAATPLNTWGDMAGTANIYVQRNPEGKVAGIYTLTSGDVTQTLFENLQPGWTVERVNNAAVSSGFTLGMTQEQMREVAIQASRELFEAARDTACGFARMPETISPSVEVSFSLFAGASFSLSATWNTADLCAPEPSPG